MRKAIILYILLIIVLSTSVVAAAEERAFSIRAEGYVIFDEANNLIKAQDNVVIESGSDEIRADKVVADLAAKTIEAEGDVILLQNNQVLEGAKLEYNYQTQQGKFYQAESESEGMYFNGQIINIEGRELLVEDSSITSCRYNDPHYQVKSKQIELTAEGKIIATGNHLWIKDKKIMPLPKYVTHLDEEERKKYAVPEPELGYNTDDGAYLEVDYDHYINEELEGHIFGKIAQKSTDILELDYLYDPEGDMKLDTYFDYNRKFGLSGNLILNNQFGSTNSRLEVNSFFTEDKDDEDYKEQSTTARLNLNRQGPNLSFFIRREGNRNENDELERRLIITDNIGEYYWRIQGSNGSEENYRPEAWLGTNNRHLYGNTRLSTNVKLGRIYEEDTKVDTIRKQWNLNLKNNRIDLSDELDLYWRSGYSISDYETDDLYQTYDLNLGSNYDIYGADWNLDYHYYNTFGETPFEFDQLTDPELGERHYFSTRLSDSWQANEDLSLNWQLRGAKNYYELENNYYNFGLSLSSDYQINDYHKLETAYRYQIKGDGDNGVAPIDRDETDWQNELELTYNFVTNQGKFPYWDVEINTLYNFALDKEELYPWQDEKDALEELELNFKREFDCFNFEFGFDIPDKGIDLGIDLKY